MRARLISFCAILTPRNRESFDPGLHFTSINPTFACSSRDIELIDIILLKLASELGGAAEFNSRLAEIFGPTARLRLTESDYIICIARNKYARKVFRELPGSLSRLHILGHNVDKWIERVSRIKRGSQLAARHTTPSSRSSPASLAITMIQRVRRGITGLRKC